VGVSQLLHGDMGVGLVIACAGALGKIRWNIGKGQKSDVIRGVGCMCCEEWGGSMQCGGA